MKTITVEQARELSKIKGSFIVWRPDQALPDSEQYCLTRRDVTRPRSLDVPDLTVFRADLDRPEGNDPAPESVAPRVAAAGKV